VDDVDLCSQQPDLGSKCTSAFVVKWAEQVGLRVPEAFVEGHQEPGAIVGGHDAARPPVGGIGSAVDKAGRLEIVEEIRHMNAIRA
jgi:hypothetical protein